MSAWLAWLAAVPLVLLIWLGVGALFGLIIRIAAGPNK